MSVNIYQSNQLLGIKHSKSVLCNTINLCQEYFTYKINYRKRHFSTDKIVTYVQKDTIILTPYNHPNNNKIIHPANSHKNMALSGEEFMPSEEHRYQVFGANNDAFQYLYP
jgi:hypothetical protein